MKTRAWQAAVLALAAAAWLAGERPARSGTLAGHVQVMGATSLTPFLLEAAGAFHRAHPAVFIHVAAGGSVAGLRQVLRGAASLAAADVPPTAVGFGGRLQGVALGPMPIALIAHPRRGGVRLSWDEARALLQGTRSHWPGQEPSDAGEKVVVVTRQEGSGALWVVRHRLLRGQPVSPDAVVELSNGAVYDVVRTTPGALGFVDAAFAGPGVAAVEVGGLLPRSPRWPLVAPAGLYWRPQAPEAAVAFAQWAARRWRGEAAAMAVEGRASRGAGADGGRGRAVPAGGGPPIDRPIGRRAGLDGPGHAGPGAPGRR
jgi:phosphate transport system substrate-binding protein